MSDATQSSFWGSGWSFPPTFEIGNYQLNLVHSEQNINQSINTVLATRRGERSLYPAFGSDLDSYLFRTMDATLKGEISNSIKACLLDYEPRIDVESVDVSFTDSPDPFVKVEILYRIKLTNTRHNHVYPFYINEGTNLLT